MEKIYIRAYYMKILHYFFFSFAVFSVTGSMMFFESFSWESASFLFMGIFYCIASMIVAYYYYKNYKQALEPFRIIKAYFVPYMVLVIWTIGSMAVLVLFFPSIRSLIYSFMFIDYYIFFFIVIGFILSRFNVVSKLFDTYTAYNLNKAKKIAKQYAYAANVSYYTVGNNPEMDEMLDDILANKSYPLPHVRRFEIALCERQIIETNRLIERSPDATTKETLEKIRDGYEEKIRKIKEKID